MSKRYYTVAQANMMLPELRKIIHSLKETREDLTLRRFQVERDKRTPHETSTVDPFFIDEAQIEFMMFSAHQQLDHLMKQSIQIKDIEAGLVDFLTLIHGEEAYLCWRSDESEVMYWHRADEGFRGRHPIERDNPTAD